MSETANEAVRALNAGEVIELIQSHIAARLEGGPNRKEEDIELGRTVGLDTEPISDLWDEAEKQVLVSLPPIEVVVLPTQGKAEGKSETLRAQKEEAKVAAEGWGKRRSLGEEASFILPDAQPEVVVDSEPQPSERGDEIDSTKALVPVARFGNETPRTPDTIPATLAQSSPYDTAKEYVRRHCFREGVLTTYFWQGEFWEWNGRYYATVEPQIIRDRVYAFLDGSRKFVGGDELTRFKPTPKIVNDVLDALKAGLTLPAECQPPMWLDIGEPATDVLVFRNGLANVLTGERLALTPRLWVQSAVDYDYDPKAKCPRWERFLVEVFPGDKESQDCIEEQLGYGMTEETKFEKAGLWIGARRSGKGTIAAILRWLVGEGAYVGLSLSTWVVNENSKENLIGKRVGVFADVRVKPGRHYGASYDAGGVSHTSQELLLNITGRDVLTIGRKYRGAWHGQLRLKMIMISNKVPNFNDPVLVSRFIKVHFGQSFEKREDVDLRNKLKAEISGIAARCLTAYRRLIARGKFIQPQSALELERNVLAQSDPWIAFVNDTFVIDPGGMVSCGVAKTKFDMWCYERGRLDMLRTAATGSLLTQQLKQIEGLEALRSFRPHGQPRQYLGLRLKTKEEREE